MPRVMEEQFLRDVLKEHEPAILFCRQLAMVSQVIDDLYDQDKDYDADAMLKAFWISLIDLHYNSFFRQHMDELVPVMQGALMDWMDSSQLEKGTDHERNIAFVLRDSLSNIVSHCALIVGGYNWMRETSVEVRRHVFEDRLDQYKEGLKQCQSAVEEGLQNLAKGKNS